MVENLIKIFADKEKAKSMLSMIDTTIEMINCLDINRFTSNMTKEYYDVLRELLSTILLLDGFKIYGEEAHKKLIEYIQENYKEFNESEIYLLNDLRIKRNKITYDGFFIEKNYLETKIIKINRMINKAKKIIEHKLKN